MGIPHRYRKEFTGASHASMPREERLKRGIGDGLLRLSVGLEAPEDLEADFAQGLATGS